MLHSRRLRGDRARASVIADRCDLSQLRSIGQKDPESLMARLLSEAESLVHEQPASLSNRDPHEDDGLHTT